MVPHLSCPPRQIAPSEVEKKSFMGRRLTQMNADKHLVFISVDRRSSAAICFFLAFSRSWPGGQCSLFQIPTAFFATYSSTFLSQADDDRHKRTARRIADCAAGRNPGARPGGTGARIPGWPCDRRCLAVEGASLLSYYNVKCYGPQSWTAGQPQ